MCVAGGNATGHPRLNSMSQHSAIMTRSGSTRSHSSDSATPKSVKENTNSKSANVKKLKEQHKKTRNDLETLEKKHEQVLNVNKELRQKFDGIEIQFKEAMKELMFYKNNVLHNQNQPHDNKHNSTVVDNAADTQYNSEYMDTDNLQIEEMQQRHNLKRSRPNENDIIRFKMCQRKRL